MLARFASFLRFSGDRMNRMSYAAAVCVFVAVFVPGSGFADDKPLIWKPSKTSDTSYSVKLGFKLPTRIETEAGVSMVRISVNRDSHFSKSRTSVSLSRGQRVRSNSGCLVAVTGD